MTSTLLYITQQQETAALYTLLFMTIASVLALFHKPLGKLIKIDNVNKRALGKRVLSVIGLGVFASSLPTLVVGIVGILWYVFWVCLGLVLVLLSIISTLF